MSQAYAERVGATVRDDRVTNIGSIEAGFYVETQDNEDTVARVAASTYDMSYLDGVLGEYFLSEDGETWLDPDPAGERGGTPVDGLRLVSRL